MGVVSTSRVLIVERNPALLRALGDFLAKQSFEIILASDTDDAIEILEQMSLQWCALVSCFNMSGPKGLALIKAAIKKGIDFEQIILVRSEDSQKLFCTESLLRDLSFATIPVYE